MRAVWKLDLDDGTPRRSEYQFGSGNTERLDLRNGWGGLEGPNGLPI